MPKCSVRNCKNITSRRLKKDGISYFRINKRNNNCYWPQLTAYCGCLELSTGIYIRSVIAAVLVTLSLMRECYLLVIMRRYRDIIFAGNFSGVENAEFDLNKVISVYRVLEIYLISWIVLIILYILFLIITVYAVYKKKQKLLKIVIYIYIPFCVFELLYFFFIVAINELHYDSSLRILLLIGYVLELYNFLAISSYYKQLRGKSLLVVEENLEIPLPTASTQTVTRVQPTNNEGSIEMHCRSCTCFIQGNIPIAGIVTAQPVATQHYITCGTNEVVNEVDNQESATESVQEMNSGTSTGCEVRVIRPNTLDLSLETAKEDKIDLSDAPVIYDEQQLNVGSSPVIENRGVQAKT